MQPSSRARASAAAAAGGVAADQGAACRGGPTTFHLYELPGADDSVNPESKGGKDVRGVSSDDSTMSPPLRIEADRSVPSSSRLAGAHRAGDGFAFIRCMTGSGPSAMSAA